MPITLEIQDDEVAELMRLRAIRASLNSKPGFHLTCVCGREVITLQRTGECWNCGREFDISAWGK